MWKYKNPNWTTKDDKEKKFHHKRQATERMTKQRRKKTTETTPITATQWTLSTDRMCRIFACAWIGETYSTCKMIVTDINLNDVSSKWMWSNFRYWGDESTARTGDEIEKGYSTHLRARIANKLSCAQCTCDSTSQKKRELNAWNQCNNERNRFQFKQFAVTTVTYPGFHRFWLIYLGFSPFSCRVRHYLPILSIISHQ